MHASDKIFELAGAKTVFVSAGKGRRTHAAGVAMRLQEIYDKGSEGICSRIGAQDCGGRGRFRRSI